MFVVLKVQPYVEPHANWRQNTWLRQGEHKLPEREGFNLKSARPMSKAYPLPLARKDLLCRMR